MQEMYHGGRIYVHGIGIDPLTSSEAEERIRYMLKLTPDEPQAIFTPNAEMIYRAATDHKFATALNAADMNTADGVGTVWASRKLGTPLPERVAGIELGEAALRAAATLHLPVFFT